MQASLTKESLQVNRIQKTRVIDLIITFFLFISTLLIGADVIGVNIGINLRLDQIFLVITALLMILRDRFKFKKNWFIVLFILVSFVSVIAGINIRRSILFYFSIIYNVIFVFYLYANYIKYYGPKKFIKVFRATMYLEFILLLVQFGLKMVFKYEIPFMPSYGEFRGINRFSLWFYEPSYFATYVSIWLSLFLYMFLIAGRKTYIKDVILSLIMLVISTSTSGFVAIALTFVLVYLLWVKKRISLKKILFLLFVIIALLAFRLIFADLFNVFISRLFNSSLDSSTGGRVTKWMETYQVFMENKWFGVGPGNYGLYLGLDEGYVPSNVTLEMMATLGIFATIVFYLLTISLIISALKVYKRSKKRFKLLPAFCLALVVFTIILQVNQGYLRLYHWMLFGILFGLINYYKMILKKEYILRKKMQQEEMENNNEGIINQ